MASLSPLFLPHHLKISAPKFPKIYTKPTLILCKASVSETHSLESVSGPDGTGAAAPTRGQKFLEHQLSLEAMTEKKAETKKKKKKQIMKKEKVLKVSMAVATCYGCGAPLQTSD